MSALYERKRPCTYQEVVGQDAALRQLDALRKRNGGALSGDCYLIAGPSGTGKTTLADLMASEIAGDWGVTVLDDPSELTPEVIAMIRLDRQRKPFGPSVYVVNEVHGFRGDQMRKLLGLTEKLPPWVTFIFTTSKTTQAALWADTDEKDALESRCKRIRLDLDEGKAAQRLQDVAKGESLDGMPLDAYRWLLTACKGNMRLAYQKIESGTMTRPFKAPNGQVFMPGGAS